MEAIIEDATTLHSPAVEVAESAEVVGISGDDEGEQDPGETSGGESLKVHLDNLDKVRVNCLLISRLCVLSYK